MAELAPTLAPLIGRHTLLLPAMNGVPWWFAMGVPGLGAAPLHSVDPGGGIAAVLPAAQVIGCVVHASAASPEPGLVQHQRGQGLIVGEPAGGTSERARHVAELLAQAGFELSVSEHIRHDLWYKLWGNLTMNPVSALRTVTSAKATPQRSPSAWPTSPPSTASWLTPTCATSARRRWPKRRPSARASAARSANHPKTAM